MAKQATSFRLSTNTISLLKELAEDESRSITNMVERLIEEKVKEKKKQKKDLTKLDFKQEARLKV